MSARIFSRSAPMPDLPILARSPLPEPLTWISPLFSHDGRRAVVLGDSGGLWLLEIDPAKRAVDARPLPITISQRRDGDWAMRPLAGSHALDRLLVWTDRMRVHVLPSGDLLHERDGPPEGEGAACLTPGGRGLLCVEEERAWSVDLDASIPDARETWAFHQAEGADGRPEAVFLDHVDTLAVHPFAGADGEGEEAGDGDDGDEWGDDDGDGEETFWLAAGCYGFVLTHLARASRGHAERVEGRSRTFGGLVYDPTAPLMPGGARHVFVLHGHRCGLAALDPATGERHDCAVRPAAHPYGFFADPADSPIAVVQCGDGALLWEPGVRLEPLSAVPGTAWKIYGGELLCAAGGELLWLRLSDLRTGRSNPR